MNATTPDLIPGLAPDYTALDVARVAVLDIIEELGAVVVHLREGREALGSGNIHGGRCDLEDAANVFGTIERLASTACACVSRLEDHLAGSIDRSEVHAGQSRPFGAAIGHDEEESE